MHIIKIVSDLSVIAFASVSVPAAYIFVGRFFHIVIFDVGFCIFCCGPELFCSELDLVTFDGALCINTRQNECAFVIGL